MKRRHFIRTTAAAAAVTTVLPLTSFKNMKPSTGLILYTVRDDMNKDPEGTLDRIAELGYDWLEAASYSGGKFYDKKPAEFRKMVKSRGMKLISSHNGLSPDNVDEVTGAASEAGLKYIVMPSLPREWNQSLDGFRKAAEFMNIAGEKCKSVGMKLGFHNHQVEFKPIDGVIPYDIMLQETDPELVLFQIDLAWITASGNDPVEYFNKYPGRFELWHVKDLSVEKQDATLGEGIIDFKPIFSKAGISGMKYFFIEQDSCRTHTPMETIRISRDHMLKNIL